MHNYFDSRSRALRELKEYFTEADTSSTFGAVITKLQTGSPEAPPTDFHPGESQLRRIERIRRAWRALKALPTYTVLILAAFYSSPPFTLQVKSTFLEWAGLIPLTGAFQSFRLTKAEESKPCNKTTRGALASFALPKHAQLQKQAIAQAKTILAEQEDLFCDAYQQLTKKEKE